MPHPYKPKEEDFESPVRAAFARQKFMAYIGAVMYKLEAGYCEIHLDYRKELSQHHGFFHGGIIGTLADNAGGFAGYSLIERNASMLTVEYKINFLNPAQGEKLIAKAHVLKHGATLTVCHSEVYILTGSEHKLCATSQMTLMKVIDKA